jgi:hypothetical protein
LRSAVKTIAAMINTTPMISSVTPVTVMRATNRTPAALMIVHSTMVMLPRRMPLVAAELGYTQELHRGKGVGVLLGRDRRIEGGGHWRVLLG